MIERESAQALPEGLAQMPPGPELAAVLASIDRARLSGFDLVILLQARARQLAFEQAELAADMVAVAERVRAESSRLPGVWDSDIESLAAAEIGAALTWTRRSALSRLRESWALVERLPEAWAALHMGCIDLPRARVLVEGTGAVPEPLARRVTAQILPEAPELTTGQLAWRLRRLVLQADPEAACKRYEAAVAERKVVGGTNPDGTGYLSGCNLPIEQAAAADDHLNALAKAAKQAGDGRPMDTIRADVYLALLSGTWNGPEPARRYGVIELTCDLPTLLGLAEHTGELAGWGPVVADISRRIAGRHCGDTQTVWRFSITDPFTGALLHHGTTRPPEITDTVKRDPRRRPTPRQRAFVVARDRSCRGPGCRVPARRAEIDHIRDHADGGPTRTWNLDAKRTTCHRLKHTGWQVHRNRYGDTTWTSLLGYPHHVPAEPITRPRDLGILEHHLLKTIRMRT